MRKCICACNFPVQHLSRSPLSFIVLLCDEYAVFLSQMRDSLKKFSGLIEEGSDPEALSLAVTVIEGIQSEQEVYIRLLEREKAALLRKVHDLGSEIIRTTSGPPRTPY
jgi:hypothetical protein